jgi:formamidopyrimidine-DNA glycosylase
MPELPEVETVRRALDETVTGRTIQAVRLSGLPLREPIPRGFARRVAGRRMAGARRLGKYLLLDLDGGLTLLSHLGMSGRWLFFAEPPSTDLPHVHVRIHFADDSQLWFQDPRRFGLLRAVPTELLARDRSLALVGIDPIASPPSGEWLHERAQGARIAVKLFLLDQKRVAGIGNIYASEILHRAGVDPRVRAERVTPEGWHAIARETGAVLNEAIDRNGTTFSMYRTMWNEPGAYGDQLRVYDRSGQPCRACGTPIRRIVQGARSTFYCPRCQRAKPRAARRSPRSRRLRATAKPPVRQRKTRRKTASSGS